MSATRLVMGGDGSFRQRRRYERHGGCVAVRSGADGAYPGWGDQLRNLEEAHVKAEL
jgi:hypothetical protein